jgi:hypothetical protein
VISIQYLRGVLTRLVIVHQSQRLHRDGNFGPVTKVCFTSKPHQNLRGSPINPPHNPNLVIPLLDIALINAKCIDPNPRTILLCKNILFFPGPEIETRELDMG